ncbi:MAG: hypothetical protein FWF80_01690 [Defluviitaleaceae bacterium]|nr:hypothetical protein [Defluviitaleaceae bacterium]
MTDQISLNAHTIVEGIAFEVINDKNTNKILASDLLNPSYKASFVVRGGDLILSVSSFREHTREQALHDAIRINARMLIDEVQNIKDNIASIKRTWTDFSGYVEFKEK